MTAVDETWLEYNGFRGEGRIRIPSNGGTLARCPGCAVDPAHPTTLACDRVGCPMKHMAGNIHNGGNKQ